MKKFLIRLKDTIKGRDKFEEWETFYNRLDTASINQFQQRTRIKNIRNSLPIGHQQ